MRLEHPGDIGARPHPSRPATPLVGDGRASRVVLIVAATVSAIAAWTLQRAVTVDLPLAADWSERTTVQLTCVGAGLVAVVAALVVLRKTIAWRRSGVPSWPVVVALANMGLAWAAALVALLSA